MSLLEYKAVLLVVTTDPYPVHGADSINADLFWV